MDETYQRVETQAHEIFRAGVAAEEREQTFDIADRLTEAELQRAAGRREFVREDAERLPLPDIARRLRDAADGEDRALAYLWARYAELRAKALEGQPFTSADATAVREINTLVTRVRERFADTKALERAKAQQQAATEVRSHATKRWHSETLAGATYEAQLRRRFGL